MENSLEMLCGPQLTVLSSEMKIIRFRFCFEEYKEKRNEIKNARPESSTRILPKNWRLNKHKQRKPEIILHLRNLDIRVLILKQLLNSNAFNK